jgi:hypothetical protein
LDIPSNFYEFWKFKLFSGNFTKSKRKEKEKMKPGTGLWFRPKTIMLGHGVGWRLWRLGATAWRPIGRPGPAVAVAQSARARGGDGHGHRS